MYNHIIFTYLNYQNSYQGGGGYSAYIPVHIPSSNVKFPLPVVQFKQNPGSISHELHLSLSIGSQTQSPP